MPSQAGMGQHFMRNMADDSQQRCAEASGAATIKKRLLTKAELVRTESLKVYEHKYEHLGYVCGIDEVGRGPLAGPVVACAVILPKDCQILYLNDSKQLSAKKREALYQQILDQAVAVGLGIVGPAAY